MRTLTGSINDVYEVYRMARTISDLSAEFSRLWENFYTAVDWTTYQLSQMEDEYETPWWSNNTRHVYTRRGYNASHRIKKGSGK